MIPNENVLRLKSRRDIYDLILQNPGLHLRELSRRTDISFGGLRHHLNFLIKLNLIKTETNRRYVRYYATNVMSKENIEIMNLLRQDVPRRIILLLLLKGPGEIFKDKKTLKKAMKKPNTDFFIYSKKELMGLTKYWKEPFNNLFSLHKHPTTLDFHLKKLIDADIIEVIKEGKALKYRIKDQDRIFWLLLKYNEDFSDQSVDMFLMWTRYFSPQTMGKLVDRFYDMLPHPYHV